MELLKKAYEIESSAKAYATDQWGTGAPDVKVLRPEGFCAHPRRVSPPIAPVLLPVCKILSPKVPGCTCSPPVGGVIFQ